MSPRFWKSGLQKRFPDGFVFAPILAGLLRVVIRGRAVKGCIIHAALPERASWSRRADFLFPDLGPAPPASSAPPAQNGRSKDDTWIDSTRAAARVEGKPGVALYAAHRDVPWLKASCRFENRNEYSTLFPVIDLRRTNPRRLRLRHHPPGHEVQG